MARLGLCPIGGMPVSHAVTQYLQRLPVQRGSAIDSVAARAQRPEVDHGVSVLTALYGLDVLQSCPHEGIPSSDLLNLNGCNGIDWKQHVHLQPWVVATHPVPASSNHKPAVVLGEVDSELRRLVSTTADVQHDPVVGQSPVRLDRRRADPPRQRIRSGDIVTSFREEAHVEHVAMPDIAAAAIAPTTTDNNAEQEAD